MTARLTLLCLLLSLSCSAYAAPVKNYAPSIDSVEHVAFSFFWNQSNPYTGLTSDRAHNIGPLDPSNHIASIAATGYELAALPVGVVHGWITSKQGYSRALTTLRFFNTKVPNNHGFYFHFIDKKSGARVWNCELSSIDTALLVMGARTAGDYWHGTEVEALAKQLTDRVDWKWMETDGGSNPLETAPSMGWYPDKGFIASRWQGYNEGIFLYWLALGSNTHPIPPSAWDGWNVDMKNVEGYIVPGGPTPLFMAEMASGFVNVNGMRDRQGRDWWTLWRNSVLADRAFCRRNPDHQKTFAEGFWGVSAGDLAPPQGYGAGSPVSGGNDGTSSPTSMLCSIMYDPNLANDALKRLIRRHSTQLKGRYGFSDAFNVDKNWYDRDVLGIDLGMLLLAVENYRSGLIWKLMKSDATVQAGLKLAGFYRASK